MEGSTKYRFLFVIGLFTGHLAKKKPEKVIRNIYARILLALRKKNIQRNLSKISVGLISDILKWYSGRGRLFVPIL